LRLSSLGDQIQTDEYRGTVTEIGSRAITLSISFWYPSSMTSVSDALDAGVRTIQDELAKAEIAPVGEGVNIQRPQPAEDTDAKDGTGHRTDDTASSVGDSTTP
jgi:hypothetical protein